MQIFIKLLSRGKEMKILDQRLGPKEIVYEQAVHLDGFSDLCVMGECLTCMCCA